MVNVFNDVPQFWKNQGLAGKLTGFETAGHAKNGCPADNSGGGTGHDGSRINFL